MILEHQLVYAFNYIRCVGHGKFDSKVCSVLFNFQQTDHCMSMIQELLDDGYESPHFLKSIIYWGFMASWFWRWNQSTNDTMKIPAKPHPKSPCETRSNARFLFTVLNTMAWSIKSYQHNVSNSMKIHPWRYALFPKSETRNVRKWRKTNYGFCSTEMHQPSHHRLCGVLEEHHDYTRTIIFALQFLSTFPLPQIYETNETTDIRYQRRARTYTARRAQSYRKLYLSALLRQWDAAWAKIYYIWERLLQSVRN